MSESMNTRLWISGAACAVAALVFGVTVVDAMSAKDALDAPVPQRASTTNPSATAPTPEVITMAAVNEAVAMDPFSPDRQPPAEPYRLPTDPEPEAPPPPEPAPPPLPAFRLVGTTQTPTGSVALIQVASADPKVVAVGESLNGFVVERIDRTTATLTQGERTVDLTLQQPALRSSGVTNRNGRVGPAGRAGQGPGGRAGENAATKALLQQMQEMAARRGQPVTVDGITVRPRRDTTSLRNPRRD
jgi:hypothetical protein